MTIKKLKENLEDRLNTLKEEYEVYSRQDSINKPDGQNYEKNEINRLIISLELKGRIKEVERTLAYLEMIKIKGEK